MKAPPTDVFEIEPSAAEFAVSKRAYLEARPEASFAYIATSALVLDNSDSAPRILLLQRAASDSDPNKWEPPGGACADEDSSILYAAARELREEAGLQAARIGGPVGDPHFFTLSNGGIVCQFNFAVHVLGEEGIELMVKLDPNEHQNFVWATEDEVRAGKSGNVDLHFTRGEVERTVLSAFDHAQRGTA
jgi:8-oxo-dGTP pyrophosphatase MutT (NUDIX family)